MASVSQATVSPISFLASQILFKKDSSHGNRDKEGQSENK